MNPQDTNVKVEGPSFPTGRAGPARKVVHCKIQMGVSKNGGTSKSSRCS